MAPTLSRWSEVVRVSARPIAALAFVCALPCAVSPRAAVAQEDDADAACAALLSTSAVAECRLVVGAARVIQPRLGAALFGGNPVPGTASTLGMRLGSLPRMSLAFRVTAAPAELPPILDRSGVEGERALLLGFTADAAVGLLTGFSPLPTVGGVLSVDAIGRLGYLPLPNGAGFHDGGAFGWALGVRVGALRESFTLPGISLSGTYGRIGRTAFGDPEAPTTDGYFDGSTSDLRLGLVATKRLGLVGITAGAAWHRYTSDLDAAFAESPGSFRIPVEGEAVHERWSAYANASWTMLIFHATGELGWQEAPTPGGVPDGLDIDPVGWFASVAFRVSI